MTLSDVLPIIGALVLSLLAAECLTYGTKLGLCLVRLGVRLLPPSLQEDLGEEWRRHVLDLGEQGHQLSAMLWGFHSLNAALKISVRTGGIETNHQRNQLAGVFLRTTAVLISAAGACTVSALALISTGSTLIPIATMSGLWLLYAIWFLDIAVHGPKDPPLNERASRDTKDLHRRQLASTLASQVKRGESFASLSQRFGLDAEVIVSLVRSFEESHGET